MGAGGTWESAAKGFSTSLVGCFGESVPSLPMALGVECVGWVPPPAFLLVRPAVGM